MEMRSPGSGFSVFVPRKVSQPHSTMRHRPVTESWEIFSISFVALRLAAQNGGHFGSSCADAAGRGHVVGQFAEQLLGVFHFTLPMGE